MSVTTKHSTKMSERSLVIKERIHSIDHFIDDLDVDIQRGVFIASFRALLAMQQYITAEGDFITEVDDVFNELLINGSIDGNYMSVMNDTELPLWIDRIKQEAAKATIVLNYNLTDVRVYHSSPWELSIELSMFIDITDTGETARWSRNQVITTSLPIEGFEDPLYTVFTEGRVINLITPTNITDFTNGQNTSNLKVHVDAGLYRAKNSSPSYLMRLKGNLSGSLYGIESFVNLKTFEDASLSIEEKSCIDYVYFSGNNPEHWLIDNTYNWLRIDNQSNHIADYEVGHLISS